MSCKYRNYSNLQTFDKMLRKAGSTPVIAIFYGCNLNKRDRDAFKNINTFANSCTHKDAIYATVSYSTSPDIVNKYLGSDVHLDSPYVVIFINEQINVELYNLDFWIIDDYLDPTLNDLGSSETRSNIQNIAYVNYLFTLYSSGGENEEEDFTRKTEELLAKHEISQKNLKYALYIAFKLSNHSVISMLWDIDPDTTRFVRSFFKAGRNIKDL